MSKIEPINPNEAVYLGRNNQQFGPYSWSDLFRFADEGNLSLEDQIWSESLATWTPLPNLKFLKNRIPKSKQSSSNRRLLILVPGIFFIVGALFLTIFLVLKPSSKLVADYYPKQGPAGSLVLISLTQAIAREDLSIFFKDSPLSIRRIEEKCVAVNIPLDQESGTLRVNVKDVESASLPFLILKPNETILHEVVLNPSNSNQTIKTKNSISVELPGGFLDGRKELSISKIENPAVLSEDPFSTQTVYDVSIDGLEGLKDYIEIGFPYDSSLLDNTLPLEAQFSPARWDDNNRVWVDLFFRVDPTQEKIYVITDHLSYFLTGISMVGLGKTALIVAAVGGTISEIGERWINDKYLSRGSKIRVLYSDKGLRKVFPDEDWKAAISRAKLHMGDSYNPKYSCAVQDIALIFEEALNRYISADFPDPTRKGIWGAHIYTRYVKVKIDSLYNYYIQQGEMAHETFWDTIHIPSEILKYEFYNPVINGQDSFERNFTFLKSGLAHELFHSFQRPYYGISLTVLETEHKWWREATAEWCGFDLASIPYRSGWEKDSTDLLTRIGYAFLRHPIHSKGRIPGTTNGVLEYEYLTAVFVRYLVREAKYKIKDLVTHVAKGSRKTDPLVYLRTFVGNQPSAFDRLYLDFAAWLLEETQLSLSDFQTPDNKQVVAEKSEILQISKEDAILRVSQTSTPACERILVFKGGTGKETLKDHRHPELIMDAYGPQYNEIEVLDGDILYFLCANGTAEDRSVDLLIEKKNENEESLIGQSTEPWVLAAQTSMALGKNGTAGVWAVKISTGSLSIDPEKLEDADGYVEYDFKVSLSGLAKDIRQVKIEYDFGDRLETSKGSVMANVVDGEAFHVLKHVFEPSPGVSDQDSPIAYKLVVNVMHLEKILASVSVPVTVKKAAVTIQPPRTLVLELSEGVTESAEHFVATATPEGSYYFEWDFDDGSTFRDPNQGKTRSETNHTFANLKMGVTFHPEVKLFNLKGELLAQDRITVTVGGTSEPGKWVLIDKKVESIKSGMIGAEPGAPYWTVGMGFASSELPYKSSGGVPPDKFWERTATARFRFTWTPFPPTIGASEQIPITMKVEDSGSSVAYTKGSHILKMETTPHYIDRISGSYKLHSGNGKIQYSVPNVTARSIYTIGKSSGSPSESTWMFSPGLKKEGEIKKIILTLKQEETWTLITYTYRFTEK